MQQGQVVAAVVIPPGYGAALAWLIGALDFLVMIFVVRGFFGVPLRGSFRACCSSSRAVRGGGDLLRHHSVKFRGGTQQQAVLYVFVLAMLDIALSGYLAPVKNMPPLFATLAQVSPLQHYLVAIRSIMLKGAGLDVLWSQALSLILIGLVMGTIAERTATRRLE